MHSESPCWRRDESFRSAGDDDSENRGCRYLKKYNVYGYGCLIKDVKKRRTRTKKRVAGKPSVLFVFFCTVYCSGNRLKINITPYGESSIIQLNELKFKIWRVTFFKSF